MALKHIEKHKESQCLSRCFRFLFLMFAIAMLVSCDEKEFEEKAFANKMQNDLKGITESSASVTSDIIVCLQNIDQLRTFYDEDNNAIKILISNDFLNGNRIMRVFVLDNNNEVLSAIDSSNIAPCVYYEGFIDVDYLDVNGDQRKDIVIIAEYSTGVGPQGMIPQTYRIIYIQSDTGYDVKEIDIADRTDGSFVWSSVSE